MVLASIVMLATTLPAGLFQIALGLELRVDDYAGWRAAVLSGWTPHLLVAGPGAQADVSVWQMGDARSFPGAWTRLAVVLRPASQTVTLVADTSPGHPAASEAIAFLRRARALAIETARATLSFAGDGYAAEHDGPLPDAIIDAILSGAEPRFDARWSQPWPHAVLTFRAQLGERGVVDLIAT